MIESFDRLTRASLRFKWVTIALAILRAGQLSAALDVNREAPPSPVARIKLLMRFLQEQVIPHRRLARRAFAIHLRAPPPPPDEARRQIFGYSPIW